MAWAIASEGEVVGQVILIVRSTILEAWPRIADRLSVRLLNVRSAWSDRICGAVLWWWASDGSLWSWVASVCEWTAGHLVSVSRAVETVPTSGRKRTGRFRSTTVLAKDWEVGDGLVRRPAAVLTLSAGLTDRPSSSMSLCSFAAFDVLVSKKVLTYGSNVPFSICTISGTVSVMALKGAILGTCACSVTPT